jgi:mannose-6-phosphate isomerase-like protein (cupin superfamily)
MKGYITEIENRTIENNNFRKVLYTATHSQLVIMSLLPNEDIGMETHTMDQFIRCEDGEGMAVLDGAEEEIESGTAIFIPAGTEHNIMNTSSTKRLQLYTLYSPPNHRDGITHPTKADAVADTEHYDGVTTTA